MENEIYVLSEMGHDETNDTLFIGPKITCFKSLCDELMPRAILDHMDLLLKHNSNYLSSYGIMDCLSSLLQERGYKLLTPQKAEYGQVHIITEKDDLKYGGYPCTPEIEEKFDLVVKNWKDKGLMDTTEE
jgi:hypothetical protein